MNDTTESLGSVLKKARKQQKLDIETLAEITKIRASTLSALEDEAFENLPAPPYVRSFLTTLSGSLGIDLQYLLKLHEKGRGVRNPEPDPSGPPAYVPPSPPETLEPEQIKRKLPLLALGVFVVLLVIIILLRSFLKDGDPEPLPEESAKIEAPASDPVPEIPPQPPEEPKVIPEPEIVPQPVKKKVPVPLERTITDEPAVESERTTPEKLNPRVTKTVAHFLSLTDSVWLGVERKNSHGATKMLYRNQTWTVTHSDSIWVNSGVEGGLGVTVNGNYYHPAKRRFIIFKNVLAE